jgi:hypothetical protein
MALTRHGHQIPGSPVEIIIPAPRIYRCGGPRRCEVCKKEAIQWSEENNMELIGKDTLRKVYLALGKAGLSHEKAQEAVTYMLNAGILFREKA